MTSLMMVASCTGCSRSSSGRANFRKPTTTRSSRRISSRNHLHVLAQIERLRAARRRRHGDRLGTAAELLLEELEVNRHRVERILHLVGDAGHQPPERRELARVVQRRVHMAQEAQVPRDEHRPEKAAARVLDGVAHQQALGRLASGSRCGPSGDRHRPLRLPAGQRALHQLSHGIVRRQERHRRLRPAREPASAAAPASTELENISSPCGENSAIASSRLSMTDSKSVARRRQLLRPHRGELRADRVEGAPQVAELLAPAGRARRRALRGPGGSSRSGSRGSDAASTAPGASRRSSKRPARSARSRPHGSGRVAARCDEQRRDADRIFAEWLVPGEDRLPQLEPALGVDGLSCVSGGAVDQGGEVLEPRPSAALRRRACCGRRRARPGRRPAA